MLIVMLCFSSTGNAQSTHWLQVSSVGKVQITEDEADDVLRHATMLLRTQDTPADVSVLVTLCQDKGPGMSIIPGCTEGDALSREPHAKPYIMNHIDGPSEIYTEDEFKDLMKAKGYVKVVSEIYWCGNDLPEGPGMFVSGCAVKNSFVVIWKPKDRKLEAVIWAHEYCHTKLTLAGVRREAQHRDQDDALMNKECKTSHRVVNASECRALLAPHLKNPFARSRTRPCDCGH